MDESVFRQKSLFKRLGLSFLIWARVLTLSLLQKLPPRKIGAFISSKKFLCPEFALYPLYPYKAAAQPCIEYFCHVKAGLPKCHLETLRKLQKWVYRAVDP